MAADANHLSIGGGYVQKLTAITFTKRLLDFVIGKVFINIKCKYELNVR